MKIEEALDRSYRENGCLLWRGATNSKRYPQIRFNGRTAYLHRLVWESTNGTIPNGYLICHRCDTRNCIEITHLFLGTPQENTQDMIAKGRAKFPQGKIGEAHHSAKLDEAKIRDIRKMNRQGYSAVSIAHAFNVQPSTVGRILKGILWRHVI